MANTFFEFIYAITQKITLGLVTVLAFLGVSLNPTIIQNAPRFYNPTVVQVEKKTIEVKDLKETPEKVILDKKPNETLPLPPKTLPVIKNEAEVTPPPAIPEAPLIPQAELNTRARASIVNIFCLTKTSGILSPISGSGVIINDKGVILTNAHVAQFLLLKDYGTKDFLDCVIRGGSPARPLYRAEILYTPSTWIETNRVNIKLDKPMGTGENDYALLLITESVNEGEPLPASFPAMPFDTDPQNNRTGDPVLVASYPAGFLDGLQTAKNLWQASSVLRVMQIYTFKENPPTTRDAFSVGGTILAQEGASGGGVFSLKTGKLVGLIATSVLEGNTSERDLRAVSIGHINESMKQETGEDLESFLQGDLAQKKNLFTALVAPQLTKILTDTLNKTQ